MKTIYIMKPSLLIGAKTTYFSIFKIKHEFALSFIIKLYLIFELSEKGVSKNVFNRLRLI